MNKGKLIVIDGADGCGKATQTRLLVEALRGIELLVETLDFPQYKQNVVGKLIGECLTGECGDFASLHPKIASMLYAADRFESSSKILGWLYDGKHVVLDRYVSANQLHQGGKIADEVKRKEFLAWLDEIEHEIFGIPRPDVIFYLDVPYAVSLGLMQEKSSKDKKQYMRRESDQHESSPEHQLAARESAITMLADESWIRIQCSDDGESILPMDVIHQKILKQCLNII